MNKILILIATLILYSVLWSCDTESPHNIIKTDTKIVSPVIELKPDLSNPPSYVSAINYKIVKINNRYFVQLPGGMVDWLESHSSIESAQKDINSRAQRSYDRWINSGGVGY